MELKRKSQQDGFAHILIFLFVVVAIIIVGAGVYVFKTNALASDLRKTKNLAFITHSPVDLAQVNNFSKFRSCSGHDYSGGNVDGVTEIMRSMKHYASPDNSLSGTTDKIKVFAPFDGSVAFVGKSKGRGVGLGLKPSAATGWTFEFGHVNPLDKITKGAAIKSGDLIGYADVSQGAGGFDLQLYHPKLINIGFNGLDSFMNHVTLAVARDFAGYGFTKENLVVSKTARDASPCKASNKQDNGDTVFVSDLAKDIVVTTKPLTSQSPNTKPSGDSTPAPNKQTTTNSNDASGECAASVPADQRPPGCAH